MMSDQDERPPADWRLLGLEPGATPEEILRAYDHRRALYDAEALASYSLLLDDERAQHHERLTAARDRLLREATAARSTAPSRPALPVEPRIPTESGPPPEREHHPGLWLRHQRLGRGVTLEQLSRETKIRGAVIEELEDERHDRLPAPVFVRGFVIQIARALGLDEPEALAGLYLRALERDR